VGITPCSPLKVNRRFGRTCRLYLQGRINKTRKPERNQVASRAYSSTLKMEATCSSETSVDFQRTTSRDSVVGIVTGYGLDNRGVGVQVPVGSRIFSSPCRPDRSGVHPTSYPMGTGGSFPGVKRPGREADHSTPVSAEVKKMWIYTSTPTNAFMASCLIS
jgi:hypothetical protein